MQGIKLFSLCWVIPSFSSPGEFVYWDKCDEDIPRGRALDFDRKRGQK